MKRKLLVFVPTVLTVLTMMAGPAAAQDDLDCDGLDDTTGEPMRRASGVCGGVS